MSTEEIIPETNVFPIEERSLDDAGLQTPHPGPIGEAEALRLRRQADTLNTARQALRIWHLRLVAGVAALYLLALAVFYAQGLVDQDTLISVAAASIGIVLGLYGVFISGLNQKVVEKKLTAPIALSALGVMLWALYSAPASRPVFTPFIFLLAAYGMYWLAQGTMLLLTTVALAGYAGVIGLHYLQPAGQEDIKFALLHWLVLAMTLPWFALLAGRVRRLHNMLYRAEMKIKNIEEHSRRDQLLGCYNRRYLIAALEEQKHISDDTGKPLCLAIIDLDHFKKINDDVGHLAGDEVLRAFARIAQENVRQGDVFGRYGGEEFLLILPETPLATALKIAERLREQVERHCWQGKLQRTVTISVGLAQYIPGESVLDLFARTDTAMYLAKRGGRNQVAVEEPSAELCLQAEARAATQADLAA